MVDTKDSKSFARERVRVQVSEPVFLGRSYFGLFFYVKRFIAPAGFLNFTASSIEFFPIIFSYFISEIVLAIFMQLETDLGENS